MKKYIYIVYSLIFITLVASIPMTMSIRKDAEQKIMEDSIKFRKNAIKELDRIFKENSYNGSATGGFGCVLYYNFVPNFKLTSLGNLKKPFINLYNNDDFLRYNELKSIYAISSNAFDKKYTMQGLHDKMMFSNIDLGEHDNLSKPLNGNNRWIADEGPFQSGWAFGYANRIDEDSYECYIVHPSMVGSTHGSLSLNDIGRVLYNSLDYYLNDKRSQFYGCINKKSTNGFMQLALRNDLDNDTTERNNLYPDDYVSNDLGRVYISTSKWKKYKVKYNNEFDAEKKRAYIKEHNNNLLIVLSIIVAVLLSIVLVLNIFHAKELKRLKQSILQRIIRLSNPNLYLKKYDSSKVEIANSIYNSALSTNENDMHTILELCDKIENNLGVSLLEQAEIKDLLERSNPKNFTNPYNAVRLEKANIIYAKLQKEKISYRMYLNIKKEIDSLYSEKITS